jgi:hypothetical protein
MIMKRLTSGARLVFSLSRLSGLPIGLALWMARAQAAPLLPELALGGTVAMAAGLDQGSARAAYFAGKRARGSAERKRQFGAGVAQARQRLAENPDDPEGLLWLAANLGAEALERGKLTALGVLGEMERLLLRLETVAPTYDHAAAARTLGRLYHKAPAFISIGSMKKARLYWDKALSRDGDYAPNLILAADFYDDDGQKERARTLARRYLAAPVSPAENPEADEWMQIARDLLGAEADPKGQP